MATPPWAVYPFPMPLASLLRDHFLEGVARGMGDKDWAALGTLAAQRAGLEKP